MASIRRLVIPARCLRQDPVRLTGNPFHHLVRVLRLRPGDQLELLDGAGGRFLGRLERITRREALVRVEARLEPLPEPTSRIVLLHGLSRGARSEWVLQKCTELGVNEIQPALCARSVARPGAGGQKLDRWQEIVAQAARQCGRPILPRLWPVLPLQRALERERGLGPGVRLVAHPGAPAPDPRLLGPQAAPQRVVLLVGPEGGLEQEELRAARERGFVPVGLGPWILRTETAAVALLAVVAHLMGRMDPIRATEDEPPG